MSRETPAASAVTRHPPEGGYQTVFACRPHLLRTIALLGGHDLEIGPADPGVHGCKGCRDGWAPDTQPGE